MRALDIILYVAACLCFALAALSVATGRINLIALGLLAGFLVPLIALIQAN